MHAVTLCLLICGTAWAVELPETLRIDKTVYHQVVYVSHTPSTVTFKHEGGTTTAKTSEAPEEVRKALDYSVIGAMAYEAKLNAEKAIADAKAAANKAATEAEERDRKWAAGPEIPNGATLSVEKFRVLYSVRGVAVAHRYVTEKATPAPIGSDPYRNIGRKLPGVSYDEVEVETLDKSRKVLIFGLPSVMADGDDFQASVADVGVQPLWLENLHAYRVVKMIPVDRD